jgi:hypothetical protein
MPVGADDNPFEGGNAVKEFLQKGLRFLLSESVGKGEAQVKLDPLLGQQSGDLVFGAKQGRGLVGKEDPGGVGMETHDSGPGSVFCREFAGGPQYLFMAEV